MALLALAVCLGCAPDEPPPPGLQINTEGGATPKGVLGGLNKYPDGPYGRGNPEVGDVVENLSFLGYYGKKDEPLRLGNGPVETSFEEMRGRGASYVLIHISSAWCGTCRPEAFYLSQYKDRIMDEGGEVLELLIEGSQVQLDPTKEELDVWIVSNDLESTTMIPNDDKVRAVFPERDYVYIIDLERMQVVWRERGPSEDPTTSEVGALEMLSVWLAE